MPLKILNTHNSILRSSRVKTVKWYCNNCFVIYIFHIIICFGEYFILVHRNQIIFLNACISSVQFTCSVVITLCDHSLWSHGLQHTKPSCPSPAPRCYSNSGPLSQWCHTTIHHPPLLCHPRLLLPTIFPTIRVFSNESVLHIRWPKYWSFSFSMSPSNGHSGLISFDMD